MLRDGRCAIIIHQVRHPSLLLPQLLEPAHGRGQEELPPAGGHHSGDRQQGGSGRDRAEDRGRPEGRERAVQEDGHGNDRQSLFSLKYIKLVFF